MINVTTLGMKAEEVRRLGTQALLDGECLDGLDILDDLCYLEPHRSELIKHLSGIMNGRHTTLELRRDISIFREFLIGVVKNHVDDAVLFLED